MSHTDEVMYGEELLQSRRRGNFAQQNMPRVFKAKTKIQRVEDHFVIQGNNTSLANKKQLSATVQSTNKILIHKKHL